MLQATAGNAADNGPQPDDVLVAAAADYPEAFGLLYDRYLARVYRYVLARTGSREDAADLTQITFARAFHSLSGYRPARAPFVAWLFRIARNAVTDAHRRRRSTVSLDGLPEVLVSADSLGPEELAEKRERLGRLRGLLAGVGAPSRELLALRFAGGLSAREIAPIVGKSEAAVKKQLTRTIATLKEHYRDEPY
ncbi:MAG TPA: sigma-70 family RNA polymerase sigma factor [Dehalococcoidia bacterium]|nr:sigma-70 family RNA polymerase sigma factor [Dehalococcoidia bacterium]